MAKVTPCCGVFAVPWYPPFGLEEPTLRCYNCDAVVSDDEMVDEDAWGECDRCGRWTFEFADILGPHGWEVWCLECAKEAKRDGNGAGEDGGHAA